MWSKIKKIPKVMWREARCLGSMLWAGVQRMWTNTWQGFKGSPWWKLVFIDLPIAITLIVLSFTLGGYFIAEAAVLVLGSAVFMSMAPDRGGQVFQHVGALLLLTIGFGVTLWAWFYVRELAWLLAFSQIPISTLEGGKVYIEARRSWNEAHPAKVEGQEAC